MLACRWSNSLKTDAKGLKLTRGGSPAWQWRRKQSPMLDCLERWQSDHICHYPHRFNELATKKLKWNGKPTLENAHRCTVLDTPDGRKITEQIDWREKQPRQMVCDSEELKWWGAWDTTCGHKAKDIRSSIAWRKEAWKEESLDSLPWKDARGQSCSQMNTGTVSKATSGETSNRRDGTHF